MAIDIDLKSAATTLKEVFANIQPLILEGTAAPVPGDLGPQFDAIFITNINSYREALLGCVLARLQDLNVNIRLPYVNQGPNAFNGRTLDEKVVNPFFQEHRIPSSGGPYLAMFRRDFRFDASKREGQRSKVLFDAFLVLIAYLESLNNETDVQVFLVYLLFRFAKLREAAEVPLARLQRMSLEQYDSLIASLLNTPSGGRLPVVLVVAAFLTIKDYFGVDWKIDYQGINVADSQSGAGGDITITQNDKIVFAAEVTERPLELSRVVSTFNTKIAPLGIENYLFFIRPEKLSEEARRQGRHYFAQGHEMNFLEIKTWVLMSLASMGKRGREIFNSHLASLIGDASIPRALKVAWNDYIAAMTTVP
ncbi:MAG: restriction endonuclease, SacI family [Acidobacteriaceae bacterium]